MAFDTSKTILLEKQYLYVRASKGFQLEGTSTERIWTNTGYYRFLVDNVAKSIGNSYVKVIYDSSDIDFIAYCSDLFMEEIQNSIVTAVENLETYLQQFAEQNHEDIGDLQTALDDLSTGLSGALESLVKKSFLTGFDVEQVVSMSSSNYVNLAMASVGDSKVYGFIGFEPFSSNGSYGKSGFRDTNSNRKYILIFPDGRVGFYASGSSSLCTLPFEGCVVKVVRIA